MLHASYRQSRYLCTLVFVRGVIKCLQEVPHLQQFYASTRLTLNLEYTHLNVALRLEHYYLRSPFTLERPWLLRPDLLPPFDCDIFDVSLEFWTRCWEGGCCCTSFCDELTDVVLEGAVVETVTGRLWMPLPLLALPLLAISWEGLDTCEFICSCSMRLGSLMFSCSLKVRQNSPILWISPFFPE